MALSPCVDRTSVVDRLVVGAIHRPSTITVTPGGKGFNVARAARLLGSPVMAAGVVGGFSGRWLAQALRSAGVEALLIPGHSETRTSHSVADLSTGVMTDFYEPATAVTSDEWSQLEQCVGERVAPGDWLSISGTLAAGAPASAVSRLVDIARRAGAHSAVDTHGPALVDAIAARADVIKVNVNEATAALTALSGVSGEATVSTRGSGLAAALGRASGAMAIVTAGRSGAYGCGLHLDCPGRGPYPVGSGDSFLGGLLTVFHGAPWPPSPSKLAAALRLATGAATANALVPGAAVFDSAEARCLADLASVTKAVRPQR